MSDATLPGIDPKSEADETWNRPEKCPFVVLIDGREKAPFSFLRITSHKQRTCKGEKYHPEVLIRTQYASLGNANGDYSIDGHQPGVDHGQRTVSVERKSIDDIVGTVLGFGGGDGPNGGHSRRERFEIELANLATLDSAAVIIEGDLYDCMLTAATANATGGKLFYRSVIALQQDHRVPWLFMSDRRMAEITTFRWLERFYRKTWETR
jgi:hypothetical protein